METKTNYSDSSYPSDEEHEAYLEKRKKLDPQPWIAPATMKRFTEENPDVFCVYFPRVVWPEHGGRMVRRDYLRAGDRAVSSHYGVRKVQEVKKSGNDGQTTTIVWAPSKPQIWDMSEQYDSSSMIEQLPA